MKNRRRIVKIMLAESTPKEDVRLMRCEYGLRRAVAFVHYFRVVLRCPSGFELGRAFLLSASAALRSLIRLVRKSWLEPSVCRKPFVLDRTRAAVPALSSYPTRLFSNATGPQ